MARCGLCIVVTLIAGEIVGCSDSAAPSQSPLPQIADLGGPVMRHPQLVPVFFSDDLDAAVLTRFSGWIVESSWLAAVGAEYGVGSGSVLGVVRRPEPAPDTMTDDDIVALLFGGLTDGSFPKPAGGDLGDVLYMFHIPAHTVVVAGRERSCSDFLGYHNARRVNGVEVAYAVVATCEGAIRNHTAVEIRELVSSHELIEAATDPFPINHPAMQLRNPASPWLGLGEEVADLCARGDQTGTWHDSGFVAQRSWSNTAATAGEDPCVPGQTEPYFNAVAAVPSLPRIPVGSHRAIRLSGWAPDAGDGFTWRLEADPATRGEPLLTIGATTMSARTSTSLDIAVAATATRDTLLRWYVYSVGSGSYQVLPMIAVAGDPCSSFTDCASCTAHSGCGFCASSGKCEAEGASGSAESSCAGSSFATWPGSCPEFCAAHSGSCADCASQPGCGWCASASGPRCLEASQNYAEPAHAACAYADWSFTPDYCTL